MQKLLAFLSRTTTVTCTKGRQEKVRGQVIYSLALPESAVPETRTYRWQVKGNPSGWRVKGNLVCPSGQRKKGIGWVGTIPYLPRCRKACRWLPLPILPLIALSTITLFVSGQSTLSSAVAQVNVGERHQVLNTIENAHDHYYERRYAEAIQAYQALLETPLEQSEKDNIRLRLGQSYVKRGEDADARRVFKEIIDENPNGSYATQAVHRLANLYWQRYQFNEAVSQCKEILKQHSGTSVASTAAYLIAQYEEAQNKYAEAVESYRYFLETFPNSPYRSSAIKSLISLYTENKHYTAAEKLIRARMEANPNDSTFLEKLAELYQRQGAHSKALALYQNALKQNSANTNLRRKLGELYAKLGKMQKAAAEWEKLVNSEPAHADRQEQLGGIYLSHKMYPEAIAAYRQAIRLEPQNGYLYIQLAAAYKIQGLLSDAARVYVEGLQNVGMVHNQRDAILFAMQDIYEPPVLPPVSNREKTSNQRSAGKGNQVRTERRDKNTLPADNASQNPVMAKLIGDIEKALLFQPRNANLTLTLAELLFHDGQPQKALERFLQLYENYPSYTEITLDRYATVLARSEHPASIDFYKTLMQIATHETRARNAKRNLTTFYQKKEKWGEAVELLTGEENAILPSSDAIETQMQLGQMQLQGLRAPKAAHMTFQRLLTRRLSASQRQEVEVGLAECHLLLKRYNLAQEILVRIAASPNAFRAIARKQLGDSYFFAANFEKALEEYKKVILVSKSDKITNDALEQIVLIQDHPDYLKIPLTNYATAVQLHLSGQKDAAVQQCQQILEAHPQALIRDDIWLLLGDIYRENHKDTEAIGAYEQVTAMESPHAAKALITLAEIYQRLADFEKAISAYTTLITNYPENVITVYARQQLDDIASLQRKNSSE